MMYRFPWGLAHPILHLSIPLVHEISRLWQGFLRQLSGKHFHISHTWGLEGLDPSHRGMAELGLQWTYNQIYMYIYICICIYIYYQDIYTYDVDTCVTCANTFADSFANPGIVASLSTPNIKWAMDRLAWRTRLAPKSSQVGIVIPISNTPNMGNV